MNVDGLKILFACDNFALICQQLNQFLKNTELQVSLKGRKYPNANEPKKIVKLDNGIRSVALNYHPSGAFSVDRHRLQRESASVRHP